MRNVIYRCGCVRSSSNSYFGSSGKASSSCTFTALLLWLYLRSEELFALIDAMLMRQRETS
ncbi:MAG: hypothetical protein ACRCYY_20085 [Trueperaceae bacterium]